MELLAPAGGRDAFIAAIENGADAVYIGGKNFSARQSAENFDEEEIKAVVEYAHIRDRKVYVTVNTLIDNSEFNAVLDYIYFLYNSGIDAVIIQDLGLMNAVRNIMPQVRLHASTQMTIHNSNGAAFLQDQGLKRIVLARELSLRDMQIIHQENPDVELEVFVHGALCYSFSGQCLFSSIVGGRSGNRGRCAQPCRLPYDLYGGKSKSRIDLGKQGRYLLSPADLCLLEHLPELKEAGVNSLKIEGRMKRPEYVATVTRTYREVLDLLKEKAVIKPRPELKNDLLKIFNRNFSIGYLFPNNAEFLSTNRPNNRGVNVGRVVDQDYNLNTRIKLIDEVSLGDGLDIWVSKGRGPAFIVKEMRSNGNLVQEAKKGEIITIRLDSKVFTGDRVFKTHDEKLLTQALESIRVENRSKIFLDVEVYLHLDEPMKLIFTDEKGNQAEVYTRNKAEKARKHPLDKAVLRDKIDRLGNTPFRLRNIVLHSDADLMIPFSDINEARREGTEMLIQKRLAVKQQSVLSQHDYNRNKSGFLLKKEAAANKTKPCLSVSVSRVDQAYSALEGGIDRVYIGTEGLTSHQRPRVEELRSLITYAQANGQQIIPVLPRIHTPSDKENMNIFNDLSVPAVMVGNPGTLKWALDRQIPVRADYSLNIFNDYTLRFLLSKGVLGACLSPELNFKQLQDYSNFDKVELLIHGELTLMVSQYCMLKGVLGDGKEKCSGFCQRDNYYIKDDKGYEFPIETDADCRFYIFNSRTLCLIEDLERLLTLNPASLRIEARRLNSFEIIKTVETYREALEKLSRGKEPDLMRYKEELARVSRSDFTKCHYYRGVL